MNSRGNKENKNSKTYYNYSKLGYFAKEFRLVKI